ncbi:hypothetical protein Cni_G25359 [Canna indica]|uniref:ENTH domain-containing protein n=1 Tax=Canna indica TaxID=4628 RepID=A0AAQ3KWW1_9LILI|nr:hypothetical protein Cni_G25359 [Canna indica]
MSAAGSTAMGSPLFNELKKQASFFLKEKIRSARLVLTDVTPVQLLTEEATSGNSWSPDAMTMKRISRAAFEVDDYWRIVEILHKRFSKFDGKNWREAYNALILLEHLLIHGPESASVEFQFDREVIQEMSNFQFIDEKGFNWGLSVKNKAERVLKLLEKGPLRNEERARARQISRGIQGFGSFNLSCSSSAQSTEEESSNSRYGRSHSDCYEDYKQSEEKRKAWSPDDKLDEQFKKTSEAEETRFINDNSCAKRLVNEEQNHLMSLDKGKRVDCVKEDHPFSSLDQESMSLLLVSHS